LEAQIRALETRSSSELGRFKADIVDITRQRDSALESNGDLADQLDLSKTIVSELQSNLSKLKEQLDQLATQKSSMSGKAAQNAEQMVCASEVDLKRTLCTQHISIHPTWS
jgi:ElaB/YqjD/DUF883 family membrane-anchored ribosome-binding protein